MGPVVGFEETCRYESLIKAIALCSRSNQDNLMGKIPPPERCFFWVDYFSLRQGQSEDFDADAVMEVIPRIGTVVAQMGDIKRTEYLSRTFCLFEIYAAIGSDAQLLFYSGNRKEEAEDKFLREPISLAVAEAWKRADKEAIDSFLGSTVGFETVNRAIMESIQRMLPRASDGLITQL